MKVLPLFAIIGLATAEATIYERQVATIIDVVNRINTDTQALDTAVKGFNGAADVATLKAASDKVAQTVSSGVTSVNGASSISLTDAVQIQGQVQTLQATIQTTVTDLIAKKDILVSAGAGQQVSDSLKQQLAGAQQLSTAIQSKVPSAVATLAGQLSSGITAALQQGVDAFQGVPGAPAQTVPAASATGASSARASANGNPSWSWSGSAMAGGAMSTSRAGAAGGTGAITSASRSPTGAASATGSRPPATFTGAANPRAVVGGMAGIAGLLVFAL